jgi:hypothetical protein
MCQQNWARRALEEQQYGNPYLYWDAPGLIEHCLNNSLKPTEEFPKQQLWTVTSGTASADQNAPVQFGRECAPSICSQITKHNHISEVSQ